MEFGRGKYDVTSRGGKGFEAVKRTDFVRVVPPPIQLVNWEELESKETKPKKSEANGEDRMLFD
jgi:hypothetical protein